MADQREAGISWTDETWNPVVGCSIVSPACTNCYAMAAAHGIQAKNAGSRRKALETGAKVPPETHYLATTKVVNGKPVWTGKLALAPDHIVTAPLRWRRPRRVFVNSMSDLFHEDMPEEWIDRVFAVMALATHHTYQILTKRPNRMRDYLGTPGHERASRHHKIMKHMFALRPGVSDDATCRGPVGAENLNIWLGITAEDQKRYDERREAILDISWSGPKFVSAEPLLGQLNLDFRDDHCDLCGGTGILARWPKGRCHICGGKGRVVINGEPSREGYRRFQWVIVGGESGPGARPMHPDWVRSIRDQCAAAGVAFHFKQWGDWIDERQATSQGMAPGDAMFDGEGRPTGGRWHFYDRGDRIGGAAIRVGKRRAGRTLDGVIHDAFPVTP